jgi:hypothetical protein
MSALLQLAERCEKAVGPDRELDAVILATIDGYTAIEERAGGWIVAVGKGVMERSLGFIDPGEHSRNFTLQHHDTPALTASLDAAMQLVPEGVCWRVIAWPKNTRGFKAGALIEGSPDAGGATPALALCAASLRARAAMEGANG